MTRLYLTLALSLWAVVSGQAVAAEPLPLVVESNAQTPATAPTNTPHRVVFVCEHGSVKSLIASMYFNQRAQQRGLPYTAISRGITPDAAVPATVQQGLQAAGFDVVHFVPQPFKTSDVDGASLVVSFDQDTTKTVAGKVQELRWDNLPGVLAHYSVGKDAIVKQVDTLIEQLATAAQTERSHE
jgi:hypothetical protein